MTNNMPMGWPLPSKIFFVFDTNLGKECNGLHFKQNVLDINYLLAPVSSNI